MVFIECAVFRDDKFACINEGSSPAEIESEICAVADYAIRRANIEKDAFDEVGKNIGNLSHRAWAHDRLRSACDNDARAEAARFWWPASCLGRSQISYNSPNLI